ncbi:hypothetical protein E1A91_A11G225000v1 [Gossypium mustelinum]|uniref:Uncharacterized protein n=3 Tax=Gossypium TaxID=3633 RepID=A0A5J5TTI1_GOSBA|nr:hypothetical protein ES319_A11G218300v1 [Gossypium barbadense]TYG95051.1 hypothetical protein ES288_A11G236700v1 [Gossypium darwinii]TYJ10697.1 hypothetical protein E1A91_A11G225000v1 [Gossypium mustelinum]
MFSQELDKRCCVGHFKSFLCSEINSQEASTFGKQGEGVFKFNFNRRQTKCK